jgi:hypothetical protein
MRYRLRTLLIVLAIGPPLLASVWLESEIWLTIASCSAILPLFALWYSMLLKSQAMDPRTRGEGSDYPIYPPPA